MKIQKVIRGIEVGAYLALSMYAIKTLCSIVVGYLLLSPKMGGLPFYYWRAEHSNSNAAKSAYGFIEPNAEDDTPVFDAFYTIVQSKYNKKKLETAKQEKEDAIEYYKNSFFLKSRADNAKEELAKIEEKLEEADLTKNGLTPLYSVGGSDSFVLGPKKTYKIFKTGKSYNKNAFDSEMNFLAFRHVFLKYLMLNNKENELDIKKRSFAPKEPKNWVSLDKKSIERFFSETDSPITFTAGDNDAVEIEIKAGDEKATVKFSKNHADAVQRYIKSYASFNELFDLLDENEKLVQFDEKTGDAKIDSRLTDSVWNVIESIGIDNIFNSDKTKFSGIEFPAFIKRLALIKPTAFDVHILNRLHYIYLMINSDMEPLEDNKYDDFGRNVDTINKKINSFELNTTSESVLKENTAKKTLNVEKMRKRRITLIFNDLSQKIAKNLGDKGYYLKSSEDDARLPILSYFAYPGIYTSKDEKKIQHQFSKNGITETA